MVGFDPSVANLKTQRLGRGDVDAIAKAGARFKSLRDTWADTTTAHGRLMLTVLGGIAEFERELIRARTMEGRARAKARGVKLGRGFKLTPSSGARALLLGSMPVNRHARSGAGPFPSAIKSNGPFAFSEWSFFGVISETATPMEWAGEETGCC